MSGILTEWRKYYEMGKLAATHIITDWSAEAGELYPELDYWMKG